MALRQNNSAITLASRLMSLMLHTSPLKYCYLTVKSLIWWFAICFSNVVDLVGSNTPQPPEQQGLPAQAHPQQANATGLPESKFEDLIAIVLSQNNSLRRKSEALNGIIGLAQSAGGLDLAQLYRFASLSEIVKTYVIGKEVAVLSLAF